MKKKRKWKGIVISVILLLLVIGGAGYGIRHVLKNRGGSVQVVSVAQINNAEWIEYGSNEGTAGTIVSDVSQEVHIQDDQVVEETFVKEGDKVKIGDKLMKYDTTLLELDQELQELNVREIGLELKAAKADLEKLKNTTPVERSNRDDSDDIGSDGLPDVGDFEFDPGDDEDDEDLALRVTDQRRLMAAQETEAQTPQNADVSETPQMSEEPQTPDGQPDDAEQPAAQNPEELPAEEFVLDGETAAQEQKDGLKGQDPRELLGTPDAVKQPLLNQRLTPFLKNVRIKGYDEQKEEVLLADTAEQTTQDDALVTAKIDGTVKLIPHFREDAEHHFEKQNTYTLLIRGIALEEDVAGKIYGTAVVDGRDYPEIGGFTMVQDTTAEAKNVVKLTLAFHDGLEREHETAAELADMYLEIPLKLSELALDELTIRTSEKEEEDVRILLEKPVQEALTEPVTEESAEQAPLADGTQNTGDTQSADGAQNADGTQTTDGSQTSDETQPKDDTEELLAQSAETQGGEMPQSDAPLTEDSAAPQEQVSRIRVLVHWNHGTNDRLKRPAEMMVYLQETQNPDAEPVGIRVTAQGAYMESGEEASAGDSTEIEGGALAGDGTDASDDTSAGDGTDSSGGAADEGISGSDEPETETEPSAAVLPEETETETGSEAGTIEDPEDTYPNTELWDYPDVAWTAPMAPGQYTASVMVPNYVPTIRWNGAALEITMNYLEPEESPLTRLEPLSELTFWSGYDGKYYKGSGTQEDPYVFFCTDGAVIRNTFVNWVLGFNEDGTVRLSEGYHVRLEIRESDTITGAFIRNVGLDGTIRVDYGYGPGTYWIFSSDSGIVKYEEDIPEKPATPNFPGGGDLGWSDDGDTYTAEELAQAIKDKELDIRELEVKEKEAKLKLKQYNKQMDECIVESTVNGYIKSVGESGSSDAYIVVMSEGGLYLKSTVSELDLDAVEKGQTVKCYSYDTGMRFEATITSIDYFPSSTGGGDMWGSSGNVNSSNYPIMAYVEEGASVSAQEYVSVTLPSVSGDEDKGIYIAQAYIRSENGQSYVYLEGADGRLRKQYIRTGGMAYGYVEVLEGISTEDFIAFPYGKSVKDGAAVEKSENGDYYF